MRHANFFPVLAVRNTVTMPGPTIPLVVGRPKSAAALKYATDRDRLILVLTQKKTEISDPKPSDLFTVGTLCKIENFQGTDEKGYQILITGISRFHVHKFHEDGDFITAEGETYPDRVYDDEVRRAALFNSLKEVSQEILALVPGIDDAIMRMIARIDDPTRMSFLAASYLVLPTEKKQKLLEEEYVEDRISQLLEIMNKEKEVLELQKNIRDKMSERLSRAQRDSLLREQMRAIQDELGESEGAVQDEIKSKLEKADFPEEVRKIADKELDRLAQLPAQSAEYHVIRNYLEWLADMPWKISKSSDIDLEKARAILDEDHYGLEKIKKRIIQHMAVAKLKRDQRGPILCLVGPPGVGKTSLGQSIARALGREFVRTSLGGVRDESEIRGHRRTYVGAMPGRIVQSIKRVGVNNPVMMLDEIDKLGASFQGDPAAAMLELLDPEQNKSFYDHYLDVPFDMSNVFFIATANMIDTIPTALRDRLEIINLSSYTINEKLQIAKRYLVPKQLAENGIQPGRATVDDGALTEIIESYTREAGVRELQRNIATIFRSVAEDIVKQKPSLVHVTREDVPRILGLKKFDSEIKEAEHRPGVVTGLAWTPFGGEILTVEASHMPGTGQVRLTGQLGDVMKESAQLAVSYVRSELSSRLPGFAFDKTDLHIHVPSGAIPKDGPSAGVTLLVALVSLLTNKSVSPAIAMTGEITLRGSILPVGGIKEKVLAAARAGVEEVFLPKRNAPEYSEVPEEIKAKLKVQFVGDVSEILQSVLGLTGLKADRERRYRPLRPVEMPRA
jgi:ATP-dependent Lon protease